MDAPAPGDDHLHEIYLRAGKSRFYFRNPDRGVSLSDERITWTSDGQANGAPLADIVEVHLESGGDWRNAISQCQITFADGYRIAVTNGSQYGTASDAQRPAYREFVRDLHGRLAAPGFVPNRGPVRYTAGYSGARYHVVVVCGILLGIIGVALPLVLLLIVQKLEVLWVLAAGIGLCWPLARIIQTNAPRDYDPSYLPEELLG